MTDRSELLAEARKIANTIDSLIDALVAVPATAAENTDQQQQQQQQQQLESEIEHAQFEFEQKFFACVPDVTEAEWIATKLLAAGYCQAEPQYITALEALNFLPALSVIRTQQGFTLELLSDGWYRAGIAAPYTAHQNLLPARVFTGGDN